MQCLGFLFTSLFHLSPCFDTIAQFHLPWGMVFTFTKIAKNARVQGTITVYRLLSKLDPAFSFPNDFPASELPEHNLVEKNYAKIIVRCRCSIYIYSYPILCWEARRYFILIDSQPQFLLFLYLPYSFMPYLMWVRVKYFYTSMSLKVWSAVLVLSYALVSVIGFFISISTGQFFFRGICCRKIHCQNIASAVN